MSRQLKKTVVKAVRRAVLSIDKFRLRRALEVLQINCSGSSEGGPCGRTREVSGWRDWRHRGTGKVVHAVFSNSPRSSPTRVHDGGSGR